MMSGPPLHESLKRRDWCHQAHPFATSTTLDTSKSRLLPRQIVCEHAAIPAFYSPHTAFRCGQTKIVPHTDGKPSAVAPRSQTSGGTVPVTANASSLSHAGRMSDILHSLSTLTDQSHCLRWNCRR